jgi:D-beta-D-heptose 7-phosphate kinase/D-beta-D-heptose 1-phosphate adenosyltransferase
MDMGSGDDLDFSDLSILVIGDTVLDCYESGKVGRISPEAPVPVLKYSGRYVVPGGAANVAMNVASLGARCLLVGLVGQDAAADELSSALAGAGVDFHPLVDGERPTTVKTRIIAANHQLVRVDREETHAIGAALEERAVAIVREMIGAVGMVLISDYAKGFLTDGVLQDVLDICREKGLPCLVDPKRRDFAAYRGATLIKPNLSELEIATGLSGGSMESIEEAARRVIAETGAMLLLTRSEKGMSLFRAGEPPLHMDAKVLEVFDVSGAGDTVFAAIGLGMASNLPMKNVLAIANAAAGVVVRKAGTATVNIAELIRSMGDDASHLSGGKHVKLKHAIDRCEAWRREGLKVGFTNGCFDLIHPGHIRILREAAARCDRLVVGLNSDASVARLKGPTRPLQEEGDRAIVLSAMTDVDLVVVFEEDTPLEVITALRPDIIVKGADYSEDQVVGADIVKAGGGEVYLVALVEGRSTTRLVERGSR